MLLIKSSSLTMSYLHMIYIDRYVRTFHAYLCLRQIYDCNNLPWDLWMLKLPEGCSISLRLVLLSLVDSGLASPWLP